MNNTITSPEKDRERLIEICEPIAPSCENHECVKCPYFEKLYPGCKAELIADTLLAKGIIVPPCQIGDDLYFIYRDEIIHVYVARIRYDVECRDDYIRKDDPLSKCLIFVFNDMGRAWEIHQKDFGHTVFYSFPDAEKALQEQAKTTQEGEKKNVF